ncbi:M1 family aminopeptidase [Thermococcus sp. LS1]|uniref:M1 family aminopeptidase n=1 Tax=Thermococcus sp. LS1 TaxID=1638259 RepID=UPI00351BCF14
MTVYYSGSCYSEEGLNLVQKELEFAFGLYTNITGIRPVERFDVVFVPGFFYRSREIFGEMAKGLDVKGTFLVDCPVDMEDSATNYASLFFHELAHEWFVHYASFHRFNEAFAEFMRFEAYSRWNPEGFPAWANNRERRAIMESGNFTYYQAMNASIPYWKVHSVLYYKGAFILRSLRFVLGNETFNEILHEALTECHGSYCTVQDFQRIAENVSGEDLDWFFSEWFNSTLLPDYTVENLTVANESGSYRLIFKLVDRNNFTMPVYVRIVTENGRFVDKTVWVENGLGSVDVTLEAKPTTIIIDPDEWMANVNREFDINGIAVKVN